MTHICVGNLTIIGSDNGLSPGRRQAIIWTNAGILLIRPLGTKFSEILVTIHTFSFMKMYLKMSTKWWPFCLGLIVSRIPCYPLGTPGEHRQQVIIFACSAPRNFLKQMWFSVDWICRNIFQWNLNQTTTVLYQEMDFKIYLNVLTLRLL